MVKTEKWYIFKRKNVPKQIYQLKITLKDISPPIWRRILVSNYLTFADLHNVIQECFYWGDYHLHEFSYRYPEPPHWRITMKGVFPDDSYPPEKEDLDMYDIGEEELRLCDVFSNKLTYVNYLYDFGDSWEHAIRLEKVFLDNECDFRSFHCVGGKRATPPEDCGGTYGYQELLEILNNSDHPEYEEMRDWVGGGFDPEKIRSSMMKMRPKEIERKFGTPLEIK